MPLVDKTGEAPIAAKGNGSYEVCECPGCFDGLVYDGERGAWVWHDRCGGTGRATAFVYARTAGTAGRLRECAGRRERFASREVVEVGSEQAERSPTVSKGDALCERCAVRLGVL